LTAAPGVCCAGAWRCPPSSGHSPWVFSHQEGTPPSLFPHPSRVPPLLLAVVSNVFHLPGLCIHDEGQVSMPLASGLLVNADVPQGMRPLAGSPAANGTVHDFSCLVSGDAQDLRGLLNRARPKEIDRQAFEEFGELGALLSPGDDHLAGTVGRAINPWHPSMDEGLELAAVEMTPYPLLVVIDAVLHLALRPGEACTLEISYPDVYTPLLHTQLNTLHNPWCLQSQQCWYSFMSSVVPSPKGVLGGFIRRPPLTHPHQSRKTLFLGILQWLPFTTSPPPGRILPCRAIQPPEILVYPQHVTLVLLHIGDLLSSNPHLLSQAPRHEPGMGDSSPLRAFPTPHTPKPTTRSPPVRSPPDCGRGRRPGDIAG
jgi:hypothetical protein